MKSISRWKHFNNPSLRSKIFAYYALLILFICITCSIILYVYMMSFAKNVVEDYALNTIQQTNLKLDNWMQEIESMSKTVMWNGNVRNLLVDYSGAPENYIEKMQVSSYLSLLTVQRDDVSSILLLKNAQILLKFSSLSFSEEEEQRWIKASETADTSYQAGNFILLGPASRKAVDNEITFAGIRKIYDKYTFGSIGSMVIELRQSKLAQFMKILNSKNKNHYLVDGGGNVLYSTNAEDVGHPLSPSYWGDLAGVETANFTKIKEGNIMVAYNRSAYTGWYIVSVTPLNEIISPFQPLRQIFLIVNLIGVTVALILAAWLSRSITSPLTELVRKMRQVKLGNLKLHLDSGQIHSYNEIERLNHTFNTMLSDIDHMINEVYEAKLKQTETELKVLRAQINPHFLYNTLDIINWKLVVNEQEEISRLVRALCGILRYNIDDSDKPVKIHEEIAQIHNYWEIQQARFGDSVQLKVNIDPEVLQLSICKFILQPIVENCVIHGFNAPLHGVIRINGYVEERKVVLEVIDNGKGMTQGSLEKLQHNQPINGSNSTGIGIHNVNQRIQLYYGEQYHIHFESKVNQGTKVTITLPYITLQ